MSRLWGCDVTSCCRLFHSSLRSSRMRRADSLLVMRLQQCRSNETQLVRGFSCLPITPFLSTSNTVLNFLICRVWAG